jgi:biotin carboxyl carrier protein
MAAKYLARHEDEEVALELRTDDGVTYAKREDDEEWHAVSLERVGDSGLFLLMVDSQPTEIYLERRRGGAIVTIGRHQFNYDVESWRPAGQRSQRQAQTSGAARITAPMTGSVVEVRCAVGDRVEAGQVVLVIESMKMNNELRAPADGVVEAVPVVAGQRVKAGELLVAVQAGESAGS